MWWAILCTASVYNYKVRAQRKIKKPTHRSVEKILPSSDLCMNSTTNFHIIPVTLLNDKRKVKRKKKRLHICHKWRRAGAKWKSAFFLRIWSLDVRNILFVYASFKKLTTMRLAWIIVNLWLLKHWSCSSTVCGNYLQEFCQQIPPNHSTLPFFSLLHRSSQCWQVPKMGVMVGIQETSSHIHHH